MELAHKLTSTRRGTLSLAVGAALLAAVLIVVYVNRYRDSVRSQSAPVTVLVAAATIPQGTAGSAVATKALYTVSTIRESQLLEGALSDPSSLAGRAATHDIYRGQQLTAADFSASATDLSSSLTEHQRVVSIPLDAAHGLVGELNAGDHVDVYVGFNIVPVNEQGVPLSGGQARPVMRLAVEDVPVVAVGAGKSGAIGSSTGNVVLKVDDLDAARLAYASDNGKIWLALRPASGAAASRPDVVTAETILLGVKPVTVLKSLGGKR